MLNILERERAYFLDEDLTALIMDRSRIFGLSPLFEGIFWVGTLLGLLGALCLANALTLLVNPRAYLGLAVVGILFGSGVARVWSSYFSLLPRAVSENRCAVISATIVLQSIG
jgi:hypothetical protein